MNSLHDILFDLDINDDFGWELENVKSVKINGTLVDTKGIDIVLSNHDLVEVELKDGRIFTEKIVQ